MNLNSDRANKNRECVAVVVLGAYSQFVGLGNHMLISIRQPLFVGDSPWTLQQPNAVVSHAGHKRLTHLQLSYGSLKYS